MIADFEDVIQDVRRSLAILSEHFSILARWHRQRLCDGELSWGSRWESCLACSGTECASDMEFFNWKLSTWVPVCLIQQRNTHTHMHLKSLAALTCIMGIHRQQEDLLSHSPSLSVHHFKWLVLGSESLWISNWFLWDCSPVHLIIKRHFHSFWNIKAHTVWNRLKLMKLIWSFVTDGWKETETTGPILAQACSCYESWDLELTFFIFNLFF